MAVKSGEVYHNPPCRQKIVVRTPAADTGGRRSVLDLYVMPGGFAADFHQHPYSVERFTLVRGRLRVHVAGRDEILSETGQTLAVPPGVTHRFFSAADTEETFAVVEFINRAERFENLLLRQLFGLAQDGLTDERGLPNALQTAATMLEFSDVLRFTSRPWPVQRALFAALVPVARMRGYRGCNPEYLARASGEVDELERLPPEVAEYQVTRPPPGPSRPRGGS